MGGDKCINNLPYGYICISIHTTRVGGDFLPFSCLFLTIYFNPHHPCGWWLKPRTADDVTEAISIHTTRVGGDRHHKLHRQHCCISIHTTRVGGDWMDCLSRFRLWDFNPHHPCGWWPFSGYSISICWSYISIHTTRVGGDRFSDNSARGEFDFNPHHPCGWWQWMILINLNLIDYFNPHHPCGWWLENGIELV